MFLANIIFQMLQELKPVSNYSSTQSAAVLARIQIIRGAACMPFTNTTASNGEGAAQQPLHALCFVPYGWDECHRGPSAVRTMGLQRRMGMAIPVGCTAAKLGRMIYRGKTMNTSVPSHCHPTKG